MIEHAPELMGADQVMNAIGLAGVFLIFMIPIIIVVLGIYGAYRHKKNKKLRKDYIEEMRSQAREAEKNIKDDLRKQTEEIKVSYKGQTNKFIHSEVPLSEMTPECISDYDIKEPQDKRRFQSLGLEFDETGRAK